MLALPPSHPFSLNSVKILRCPILSTKIPRIQPLVYLPCNVFPHGDSVQIYLNMLRHSNIVLQKKKKLGRQQIPIGSTETVKIKRMKRMETM